MARRAPGSPAVKLKRPEREPETAGLPGEPSQLQLLHCLRDLAGLQSFPARCAGRTLPEVAVAGIETAQALVPSELAYLQLKAGRETLAEVGRLNGKPAREEDLGSLRSALSPLLDAPSGVVTTFVWPDGNAPLQAFVIPLGFYGQGGSLVIASRDAQFPGELQVAVLRSAASLIATAAESARLLVETREAQVRASFLSDASAALSASFGSQELWRRLAAHTVPRFADGWILAFEPDPAGRQPLVTAAHLEAHRAEAFEAVCGAAPMAAGAIHGAEEVRRGAPSLLNAECREAEGSRSAEEQAFTAGLAPFSSMVVPVIVRGCPAGVMIFFRSLVRPRYRVADLDLAEELGKRVGVTLENGRLFREARRADRRKEEFLALLGHELRNPLAPILTTLEVMRLHGDAFARERQLLERHARHLSHLVDDLLDISRITRGKIQLELRPVLLEGAVTEAIESVSPLLAQRGHHLKRTETAEQAVVVGDATRLAQIIGNLLHNAAQYTPPGGHLVVASALDGDDVIVQVRDDGEGIPPEMLSEIFELFSQKGRSLARSEGGLGLGLALVKALTELHGGSVSVSSRGTGLGSEFTVRLPRSTLTILPETPALPPRASGHRPRRVLIVDDNADSAEALAEALEAFGYVTQAVFDGPSALVCSPAFAPDIALLDIGLPIMNGYEIAGALREALGPALTLIAVTGYGQETDRFRAREAGFDAYLTKPIELPSLLSLLSLSAEAVPSETS